MALNGFQYAAFLAQETVWLDAPRLNEAEARYQVHLANFGNCPIANFGNCPITTEVNMCGAGDGPKSTRVSMSGAGGGPVVKPKTPKEEAPVVTSTLVSEIENVRSKIQNFIKAADKEHPFPGHVVDRLQKLEQENAEFRKIIARMSTQIQWMSEKLEDLDLQASRLVPPTSKIEKPAVVKNLFSVVKNGTDDDDDMNLFGSDEESEDEKRVKEERLKAYEIKKSKKTQVVAKSSVVLDVKPWSDETDLKTMEDNVRKIESVGLKWGASKLVPLAYGIKKLQIIAIVEDDNCSIDWLQEQIEAIEDLVQSVDIAAFNKL